MKLKDLIKNVIKDSSNESIPNWEAISNEFNINLYWSEDKRLKSYVLKEELCTDNHVGIYVYFLDEQLVYIREQKYRRSKSTIKFIDEDSKDKVRKYIFDLYSDSENSDGHDYINEDEVIEDMYSVEYNSRILSDIGYFNGEKVKIVQKRFPYSDKERHFHTVIVENNKGERFEVDCRNLRFKYNSNYDI